MQKPSRTDKERLPRIADHPLQTGETRRIADQLEDPDKAEKARVARVEHDVERRREAPRARSQIPPIEAAQARRERHLPRCSAPGAPGAAVRRRTYSAKKNAQTIWNPASSASAQASRQASTVSASMIADSRRDHGMVDTAKCSGADSGLVGLQEPIKTLAVHASF